MPLFPDQSIPVAWAMTAACIIAVPLFAWLAGMHRSVRHLRADLHRAHIRLAAAGERAEQTELLNDRLEKEQARCRELEAALSAEKARLCERERALDELHTRYDTAFTAATAKMLDSAQKAFLERAGETFSRFHETARSDDTARRKTLDEMMRPVGEMLARYEKSLAGMRAEQMESRGRLQGQMGALAQSVHAVSSEARNLANALRSSPNIRGRWGEIQLRNVVELAGMSAHIDYVEQPSHRDEDTARLKRPDMIVNLPGKRVIVVDSKVSLDAYLDAGEAGSDEERAKHLRRHAESFSKHIRTLSEKHYPASVKDSLDYVVMFVPGENYYAAALETRPELYRNALDRQIMIATPTILVALLKTAALNWKQEKMTEKVRDMLATGKKLYESLGTMGEHFITLGKSLDRTVRQYNTTAGSLEARVLARARKFRSYELPGIDREIPPVNTLESYPKEIRQERNRTVSPGDPET